MKAVRYSLDVYRDTDSGDILASFAASTPFMDVQPGAMLNVGAFGDSEQDVQPLEIVGIEHCISESEFIDQRTKVYVRGLSEMDDQEFVPDWGLASAVNGLKDKARNQVKAVANGMKVPEWKNGSAKIIEQYKPIIWELLEKRLGSLATDTLQDDQVMDSAFRSIYQLLPAPVRLTIKEEIFVKFCLKHRDRFLQKSAQDDPALIASDQATSPT